MVLRNLKEQVDLRGNILNWEFRSIRYPGKHKMDYGNWLLHSGGWGWKVVIH